VVVPRSVMSVTAGASSLVAVKFFDEHLDNGAGVAV
jgi:hypothetical protein